MVIEMDYQNIINMLKSDDYYKVKDNIKSLINNLGFIEKITRINNPIVFDRFIKMCEYKMDTAVICEERNKYVKKVLLNLKEEDLCNYFDLEEEKRKVADRYLIEYIVFYYFGDNYYNFMTNFYQMLNYLRHTNKDLIDKENISIYQEFVNLRNMSFKDKIGFFKLFLNDNHLMEMFYDDITKLREESHKELVDKSLKLNQDSDLYQVDLSRRFGVPVYYLDGAEFYGFVRCLSVKSNELIFLLYFSFILFNSGTVFDNIFN